MSTASRMATAAALSFTMLMGGCASCGPLHSNWSWNEGDKKVVNGPTKGFRTVLLNTGKKPVYIWGIYSGFTSLSMETKDLPIKILEPGRIWVAEPVERASHCLVPTTVWYSCLRSDSPEAAAIGGTLPNMLVKDWVKGCT